MSTATWAGNGGNTDDGQGDPYVPNYPYPGAPNPISGVTSGTHHFVQPVTGDTFTITISGAASANGSASVTSSITATPVMIGVTNAYLNGSSLDSLPGVHMVATATAGDFAIESPDYSIAGGTNIYKDVDVTGPITAPTSRSWVYLEPSDYLMPSLTFAAGSPCSMTVSATCNIYLNGQFIGGASAKTSITIESPVFPYSVVTLGTAGYLQSNISPVSLISSVNFQNFYPGIGFKAEVWEATWQNTNFGQAQEGYVQIGSAEVKQTFSNHPPSDLSFSGLDTQYPYPITLTGYTPPASHSYESTFFNTPLIIYSDDTPQMGLSEDPTDFSTSASFNCSFKHVLLFQANISSDPIPLEEILWTWDSSGSETLFAWSGPFGAGQDPSGSPTSLGSYNYPFSNFVWNSVMNPLTSNSRKIL